METKTKLRRAKTSPCADSTKNGGGAATKSSKERLPEGAKAPEDEVERRDSPSSSKTSKRDPHRKKSLHGKTLDIFLSLFVCLFMGVR